MWSHGNLSIGGLAAATAMALRLNGISHWVMWEMTSLYEQVGTVQDGINTLTIQNQIIDKVDAQPLAVKQGEVSFLEVDFGYNQQQQENNQILLKGLNLIIRPGEKVGLVGRSGAGKSTIVNLLLRFYEVEKGAILIDHQNNILPNYNPATNLNYYFNDDRSKITLYRRPDHIAEVTFDTDKNVQLTVNQDGTIVRQQVNQGGSTVINIKQTK
jgi:ABC-type transport system involved in cytochrome bd biosynthesis fused ATPase/permease subunit